MSTLWNKLSLSMITNLAQAMRKCKELAGANFRQNRKHVCNVYDRFVRRNENSPQGLDDMPKNEAKL